MEYRFLGRSGLKVSTITLGTWTFGSKPAEATGSIPLAEARRHIDLCLEAGVNLLDTADVYDAGASEAIIGEALEGRRQDVLLATKVRFPMGTGPNDRGLSRARIIAACEASLRRLRTDWIDLYQMHEWDGLAPLEETMEALDSLVRSGKVRYVGCSNFSGWHVMKAQAVAARDGRTPLVSQQIHYTPEAREAEYELVPIAIDQGIGILIYSPLTGGLLSGKVRRGETPSPRWRPQIRDEGRLFDIIDVLVDIGEARGIPAAQVALAWTLGRPGVTSIIIGGRTEEQLRVNLGAADITLSDEERARLDAVSRLPLLYPYWHQAAYAADRLSAADLALLGPYL